MNISIDREKFVVRKGSEEFSLPKKEFETLRFLCSVPGKVFSRKEIFKQIWGEDSCSKERTVDVHILNIRKKLGADVILTNKGVGYKCKCQ